jgi:hypothetical protein
VSEMDAAWPPSVFLSLYATRAGSTGSEKYTDNRYIQFRVLQEQPAGKARITAGARVLFSTWRKVRRTSCRNAIVRRQLSLQFPGFHHPGTTGFVGTGVTAIPRRATQKNGRASLRQVRNTTGLTAKELAAQFFHWRPKSVVPRRR